MGMGNQDGSDQENRDIKKGLVLYAGWDADEARQYALDNEYTPHDVKIVRRGDQVLVIKI